MKSKYRSNIISDKTKVLMIRWWVAGSVYFFVGFGTGLGSSMLFIDFAILLAGVFTLAEMLIVEPIESLYFLIVDEYVESIKDSYTKRMKHRLFKFFLNLLIVTAIAYTYNFINLMAIKLLSLDSSAVAIPTEPILFGAMYLGYYLIVEKLRSIRKK